MINKAISIMKKEPFLLAGILLIIIIIILAFTSLFISTENVQDLDSTLLPIGSKDHILGTDYLGRDVFDRVIVGAGISLFIGITASLISLFIGIILGVLSGYFSGLIDNIIMRFTDIVMAFPVLLLMVT